MKSCLVEGKRVNRAEVKRGESSKTYVWYVSVIRDHELECALNGNPPKGKLLIG